jgi:hypothetical protein
LKKCVGQLIENEDCHSHVDASIKDPRLLPEGSNFMTMCRGGYMCMGNEDNRRCMPFRGGAVGNFCNFTLNGHYECEFGLQCHKTQYKCVEHSVIILMFNSIRDLIFNAQEIEIATPMKLASVNKI